MNILIISRPFKYGAGVVAFKLLENFKEKGHNTKLFVKYNPEKSKDVISLYNKFSFFIYKITNKIVKVISRKKEVEKDPKFYFYDHLEEKNYISTKKILKKIRMKPEIIILIWTAQFINSKNIFELNLYTKAPIFWYLMDMGALTGGCHYAWDCIKYENNCGNCPAFYSSNKEDLSYHNLLLKKKYLNQTNLTIIAGSEWLQRQAKASSVFKKQKNHKIMLSIEPNVFKPFDKQTVRKYLKLPLDKKIIFFGAISFKEERKGMSYLLKALLHLKSLLLFKNSNINPLLLIAGKTDESFFYDLPFDFIYIGSLNNQPELASAYQASDIFACPSIEDSGPMMINEALMCGTPVVSFEIGVALDLVHNRITGYRAKLKDIKDFAQGLFEILHLNYESYKKMSKNCRNLAVKKCHPNVQIQHFENLFKLKKN